MTNIDHKSQEVLAKELEIAKEQVPVGSTWAHYKHPENHYLIIDHALDEEHDEPAVEYEAQYGKRLRWFRRLSVWMSTVEWEGKTVPRFTKLG